MSVKGVHKFSCSRFSLSSHKNLIHKESFFQLSNLRIKKLPLNNLRYNFFVQDCVWSAEPRVCHRGWRSGAGDHKGSLSEGPSTQQLLLLLYLGWCWSCGVYWALIFLCSMDLLSWWTLITKWHYQSRVKSCGGHKAQLFADHWNFEDQ